MQLQARISSRVATMVLAPVDLAVAVAVADGFSRGRLGPLSWALPVGLVVSLAVSGRYHVRISPSVARDVRAVVGFTIALFAVLAAARPRALPLTTYAVAALVLVALLLTGRIVLYGTLRWLRSRGFLAERTLVVGAGQVAVDLAATMRDHPEFGLVPVGFLDDVGSDSLPLPVLGGVGSLPLVLADERVDRVVVAFGAAREADMVETIRACDDASVEIDVLPRFFELGVAADGKDVDELWGIPLVRLRRSPRRSWSRVAKRVLDVVMAGLTLVVLSPLYGLLALAVKVSSPGPVHFSQRRVGHQGEIVVIRKFRSMRVHDGGDTEWNPGDEGVTPVGKVMRRFNLDELPQLLDVVRGAMSLVGPRPERPFFVQRFRREVPHYDARHRVPVGLTGLAQVNGLRGDTSIDHRARFDNRYIESWTLWRDVVILGRTFAALLRDVTRPNGRRTRTAPAPSGAVIAGCGVVGPGPEQMAETAPAIAYVANGDVPVDAGADQVHGRAESAPADDPNRQSVSAVDAHRRVSRACPRGVRAAGPE